MANRTKVEDIVPLWDPAQRGSSHVKVHLEGAVSVIRVGARSTMAAEGTGDGLTDLAIALPKTRYRDRSEMRLN